MATARGGAILKTTRFWLKAPNTNAEIGATCLARARARQAGPPSLAARQSPTLPGARGGEIPPRDSPAPSQMGFHLGRSGKSYSGSLQSRTRYCNYLTRNSCSGWRGEENDGLGYVLAFGPALKIFGFHCGNVRCSIDKPGPTALTRIAESLPSNARVRVRASTPALAQL